MMRKNTKTPYLHTDLEVWKKSFKLSKMVYFFSNKLPDEEKFGLISQIRRSSLSVPSNIAEGSARFSDKENLRFLYIALGSLAELHTQILFIQDVFNIDTDEILEYIKEVRKLLSGYINYKKKKN